MRTMAEVATTQTLLFLSRLVKASLEETKDFWGTFEQPSKLLPLVDINGELLFRVRLERCADETS
jgi:E3 ubiquitin-protein ligase HUWE1